MTYQSTQGDLQLCPNRTARSTPSTACLPFGSCTMRCVHSFIFSCPMYWPPCLAVSSWTVFLWIPFKPVTQIMQPRKIGHLKSSMFTSVYLVIFLEKISGKKKRQLSLSTQILSEPTVLLLCSVSTALIVEKGKPRLRTTLTAHPAQSHISNKHVYFSNTILKKALLTLKSLLINGEHLAEL